MIERSRHAEVRLFLCSMAALYWELVLIRWLGSCIRLAAYYSNFVLIAAFWGLATGVLLTRFKVRLNRLIFPALAATLILGLVLAGFSFNLSGSEEFVWIGAPPGVYLPQVGRIFSAVGILSLVYCSVAGVFLIFGQWIGGLFKQLPALRPIRSKSAAASSAWFCSRSSHTCALRRRSGFFADLFC